MWSELELAQPERVHLSLWQWLRHRHDWAPWRRILGREAGMYERECMTCTRLQQRRYHW